MNQNLVKLMLIAVSTVFYTQATAQNNFINTQKEGSNYFALVNNKNLIGGSLLQQEQSSIRQLTNSSPAYDFIIANTYVDNLEFIHKKFKVYYKSIEVIGMDFTIHEKKGAIQYMNGTFENLEDVTITPIINKLYSNKKAIQYFTSLSKDELFKNSTVENKGLCIIKEPKSNKYNLSYKIFIDTKKANGKYVYINALNGNFINYENLFCNTNAPGTAQTRYSGTQNFITDKVGTQYRLREVRNGVNIKTLNANYESDIEVTVNNATDFWDTNDNNWTTVEHGNNNIATDVHWAMEKTYDYWLTKHNRNSINNAGMDIASYVHFGSGYDNALWSGSKNAMFFGDGSTYFRPLTSVDICAHEMGHGICQYTSNLSYASGTESSALNEGFSDIWGACIEAYAAPNKQRWLIGEEVTLAAPGYLRSMSNPPSGAFSPSSDTYGDVRWNNNDDAHYRSGVLNKWFYLLSEGGSGTNGVGNIYSVTGITINKAEKIAYRTELLLNTSSNYAMARTMSIQAAQELYGVGSCEEIAVIKAWYAVNVGANYISSSAAINGTNNLCSQSSSVFTTNATTNTTITWSVSGLSGATVNPTVGASTTLSIPSVPNNYGGYVTLTASFSGGCANILPTSKQIYIGTPLYSYPPISYLLNGQTVVAQKYTGVGSENNVCQGPYVTMATEVVGANNVTWSKVYSNYVTYWSQDVPGRPNDLRFYLYNPNHQARFQLLATNNCGTINDIYAFKPISCGGGGGGCLLYQVSPNPATNLITIIVPPVPAPCFAGSNNNVDYKTLNVNNITITDQLGNIKLAKNFNDVKTATLDISLLTAGSYILRIGNGKYTEQQKIIVVSK